VLHPEFDWFGKMKETQADKKSGPEEDTASLDNKGTPPPGASSRRRR
jgi:hypothetical protein